MSERSFFDYFAHCLRNLHGWLSFDAYGCSRQARSAVRAGAEGPPSVHTGCFNVVLSIGSFRKRLPVAAKIALVTAGTMAEVPASPIPPGGSELWTMWTSMAGASFIRSIW